MKAVSIAALRCYFHAHHAGRRRGHAQDRHPAARHLGHFNQRDRSEGRYLQEARAQSGPSLHRCRCRGDRRHHWRFSRPLDRERHLDGDRRLRQGRTASHLLVRNGRSAGNLLVRAGEFADQDAGRHERQDHRLFGRRLVEPRRAAGAAGAGEDQRQADGARRRHGKHHRRHERPGRCRLVGDAVRIEGFRRRQDPHYRPGRRRQSPAGPHRARQLYERQHAGDEEGSDRALHGRLQGGDRLHVFVAGSAQDVCRDRRRPAVDRAENANLGAEGCRPIPIRSSAWIR